jgi:hypothetical protein
MWRYFTAAMAAFHQLPARYQNYTEKIPGRHTSFVVSAYSGNVMRGAFVVRLGPDTDPSQDRFEGRVEEVDSGKELRFHSTDELMQFLGERFRAAFQSLHKEADQGPARGFCGEKES